MCSIDVRGDILESMIAALIRAKVKKSNLAGFERSESISGSNPPIVPIKISQGASTKSINWTLIANVAVPVLAKAATNKCVLKFAISDEYFSCVLQLYLGNGVLGR